METDISVCCLTEFSRHALDSDSSGLVFDGRVIFSVDRPEAGVMPQYWSVPHIQYTSNSKGWMLDR